ncbi:MAG: alpha/beta hydrolase [Rhodospirillales bacterium 20-64-7]|nr:MAG: alpha/beta hydrolase [Rhodospirillales bacterium 20-64-7]HQT76065.1 alpha/beta hydrolase [Rhodopila sp.]
MRSGTVQLDKGTLETAWWGPGPDQAPTLVLLHEGLGCIALWRDVPERLAEATGWGIFAYSRFGYGQSDPAPLPWPVTYMHHEAQTILPAVLLAAGVKRMALLGHSDGGSIAAIYAGTVGASPALAGIAMMAAHFFVEDLNIASIERIKVDYDTGDLRPRLARYHQNVDIAFRGWNDTWLDPRFRDFDLTGFLPKIACPILGLQGAEDPYGTDEQLRVLARHATAPMQTRLIPGAKHSPHLEAKATTLDAIAGFVRSLTP